MLLLSCAYCVPLNNNTCIFPIFRLWVLCIHLRRIPYVHHKLSLESVF
ncbi:unnamed protein product [Spirodela intermedia]|uniref:Uncharacterized protein n=1 Tax=Spirodela intermedia TaxID=51605 RepID=A0A7I8KL48_SPIIN|nr:unnamed protein product [Spirodela intermedia]